MSRLSSRSRLRKLSFWRDLMGFLAMESSLSLGMMCHTMLGGLGR